MGDAGGLAWNITASVVDFLPKHSIGINYAETEAGWLVSPEYRNNERLTEIRYMWRPNDRMTVDIPARLREDLQQRIIEDTDRDGFDFFMRFTWPFNLLGESRQMRQGKQIVLAGLVLVFRDFCFPDVIADANFPAENDYRQTIENRFFP